MWLNLENWNLKTVNILDLMLYDDRIKDKITKWYQIWKRIFVLTGDGKEIKKMGLQKLIGHWFTCLRVHSKERGINNTFGLHITDSRTSNNPQIWYHFCNMLCRSALQKWFQGEADLC
jgi:hypothetical protein